MMLIFLVAGSFLLMGNFVYLFSFSFCFIQQFVRGFSSTIIADYINKLTDSSMRATILSVQSLVGKLIYAVILPIVGWVADVYTLIQALVLVGITALLCGVLMVVVFVKAKIY